MQVIVILLFSVLHSQSLAWTKVGIFALLESDQMFYPCHKKFQVNRNVEVPCLKKRLKLLS